MDAQLKEIIEKIKKDGVETAEEKADSILKDATKEGEEIIAEANAKAEKILSDAKKKAEKTEQSGREALKQASRDMKLTVQKELESMFNRVMHHEVSATLKDDILENAIITVVTAWSKEKSSDINVLLSEEDKNKLSEHLLNRLQSEIKKGIEIKAAPGVESGFRIEEKDGAAYYNFTSQGITEALAQYVNPMLAKLLRESEE